MDKTKLSFIELDDTTATVKLPEEFLIGSSELLLKEIGSLRKVKLEKIVIDYSDLAKFDSILVVMRGDVIEFAEKSSIEFEEKSQSEEAAGFIKMLTAKDLDEPPHKKTGLFKQYVIDIGNEFLNITGDAYEFIEFTGKVFIKTLAAIVMPWKVRWKDFPLHFTRSGVNSVPIVVMILFLLGLAHLA